VIPTDVEGVSTAEKISHLAATESANALMFVRTVFSLFIMNSVTLS